MENSYKHIWVFFTVAFVIVAAGFFKTYFIQFPRFETTSAIIHFHALFFILWFVMLFTQPLLIRRGAYNLHKKVGRFSYLLVPLITFSTILVSRAVYLRNLEKFSVSQCIGNLIFPFSQIIVFDLLFLLAIWNVRKTPVHMRYIIASSVILMGPAIRRIFVHWTGMAPQLAATITFLILALVFIFFFFYDGAQGMWHKPFAVALILLVLFFISYNYFPQTRIWQKTCGWFVGQFF